MTRKIDETKDYIILDEMHYCCEEAQFKYICKKCGDFMGCYFCEFNYTEPCGCGTL